MTPEARRWAVLLMLATFRENRDLERSRDAVHDDDEPPQEMQTFAALREALAEFGRERSEQARLLWLYATGGWQDAPSEIVERMNEQLDWLAERLPDPIVLPRGGDWELRFADRELWDVYADPVPRPPDHVIDELVHAWSQADRDHRGSDDDDWSAPALHPGEDRAGDELIARYGEGEPTYHIDPRRAPSGLPGGRPRRGSNDPAQAEQALLERCPARSIEELRGCLGRGRKTPAQQQIHAELAAAIRAVRAERLATPGAIASVLGIDTRTVRRLAERKCPETPSDSDDPLDGSQHSQDRERIEAHRYQQRSDP